MSCTDNNEKYLKEAIIKTIAFFDMFDYPLAIMEVYKYLYMSPPICPSAPAGGLDDGAPASLPAGGKSGGSRIADIERLSDELARKNILGRKNGFYFLKGRDGIVFERLRRSNRSGIKISRAKKIVRLFSALPWIKMIALGNVMGSRNFKKESDIDLIIVTAKNRIWITRFFCASLAAVLGLRPAEGKTENRICLSFFVSEDRLDLGFLSGPDDICFYYWLAGFIPLYERGDIFQKLYKANGWLKEILPNYDPALPTGVIMVRRTVLAAMIGKVIDLATGWLEPIIMNFQLRIFPPPIKEKLNQGTDVFTDNSIIKLHVNDRRKMYRAEWEKRARKTIMMIKNY
ncbi:MAG: hypothetical protein WC745_05240 [Patescibacteria group bacterium]|jgi:predicted nucleotidyltransferase